MIGQETRADREKGDSDSPQPLWKQGRSSKSHHEWRDRLREAEQLLGLMNIKLVVNLDC